jgi:TolB protein
MKWISLFVILISLGILAWGFESGAADVILEVTRPDFQKIPIGLLPFKEAAAKGSAGRQVIDVLAGDLRRSQVFSVAELEKLVKLGIKPDAVDLAEGPRKTLIKQAMDGGISVLVWGRMGARQTDVVMDGYVYDGGSGEVVAGKRYVGTSSALRLMAHRLADELVLRYTGEMGIARTKIAYVSEHAGARELFVMDYDGYAPRQVTADGFLNLMPRWSPDRKYLLYTAYRSRTRQDIELLELATGKRWTLVNLPGLNITPAVSPDGVWVAFATSHDGNHEIYKINTATKELIRLTLHPSGDLSPSWAPSGQEIAFTSDRGGGPQIYIMSADGSNVRRLTYEGNYNAAPAWSPRSNWIAYVCRTEERQYKLCLISPDGQKRLQITTGTSVDDSPSWSPDGRHLVYSALSDGNSHLYMINMDGTDREQLTRGDTHNSSPAWSPAAQAS